MNQFLLRTGLLLCVLLFALAGAGECAPSEQYANIAPLPGAGTAVDAQGNADGCGAMQINIPVAYTPGLGYFTASAFKGAHIGASQTEFGNGTGAFALGLGQRTPLFLSAMRTSREASEDSVVNVQLSLTRGSARLPALAVGQQDLLGKESGGESPYVVATHAAELHGVRFFVTAGYGGGRFADSMFAGLSVPVGDLLNLAVEYDGFQSNYGVGYRPGGRRGPLTLVAGHNGRAGWLMGVSVTLGRTCAPAF